MQDNQWTVRTFWIFKRHDDLLTWCQVSKIGQVFRHRLTCTSDAITVQEAVSQEIFHNGRHTTDIVQVLEDILTGWFQIRQMRHALLNDIEIIQGQLHISRMSNGQQVQSGIGRTTQSHGHCDGIFKGFASQNVRRLKPHFQHPDNCSASFHDIVFLILRFCWVRRRARQAHPKNFNSCRHSISRVHTTTATRARTGITLDAAHFLSSQIAMVPLPDAFKDRN